MGLSIYDDGSTLIQDEAGNVVSLTNNQGQAVAVAGAVGSGVVQQFANLLNYWGNAAINAKYGAAAASPQAAVAAQQSQNLSGLVIVGVIALIAYRVLAK